MSMCCYMAEKEVVCSGLLSNCDIINNDNIFSHNQSMSPFQFHQNKKDGRNYLQS